MSLELNFDSDIRREQEIKRLLIEDEMDYWIGNPVVQIIHGQLMLDQDKQNSLSFNASIEQLANQRILIAQQYQQQGFNSLVAFGISNSKSPVEISEFFKELAYSNGIVEIRVIKTASNIMYAMILFFQSNDQCYQFISKHFGQRFNTIEDDIILLRPILNITLSVDAYDIKNEEESLLFSKHNSKNSSNSTTSHNTNNTITSNNNNNNNNNNNSNNNTNSNNNNSIPQTSSSSQQQNNTIFIVNSQELLSSSTLSLTFNIMQTESNQVINCAICQDPLIVAQKDLDSPTKKALKAQTQTNEESEIKNQGIEQLQNNISPNKNQCQLKKNQNDQILSIMCGHYFHSSCLSKWQDSICPLCRYHQQPPELSYCEVCRSSESLWMCLICGSKNCGMEFMTSSHVKMHYEETKHTYSMEIESKFVYDHSRDSFVHRLMQNLADGKIVEVSDFQNGNQMNEQSMNTNEYDKGKKNVDSLKEYEIQMSTGLEAQRKEYQLKLSEIKKNHAKKLQEQEQRKKEALEQLRLERQQLEEEEKLQKQEENELNQIKTHFLQLSTKKNELQKEENILSQKHQQLGQSSEKQQDNLKKKLLIIKSEIESKILEIKDIESHLKANKKIKDSGVDASKSALLVLGSSQSNPYNNKKKKKKN